MKKFMFASVALTALAACGGGSGSGVVEFDTYEVQANGDVVLTAGDEEYTVPAGSVSQYSWGGDYGSYSYPIVANGYNRVVFDETDDAQMAAGVMRIDDGVNPVTYTAFGGMSGTPTTAPNESASYTGTWAAAHQTDHDDIHINYGDLTIDYTLADGSVDGSGTLVGDSTEYLTIDGQAQSDGSITGTATLSLYSNNPTGDLTAGFFGDDGGEIAGAFIGDGIGGVFSADRDAPIVALD